MGLTDSTLKELKAAMKLAQEKTEGKEKEISDVCTATEKVVAHTVVHRFLTEKSNATPNHAARLLFGVPLKLGSLAMRWNLMTELAASIDKLLEENPSCVAEPVAEEQTEEVVEETVTEEVAETEETAEETVVEEPAAEEEPVVETFAETSVDGEEDEEDGEEPAGDLSGLEFIDVMEEPERYAEMKEQESRGEVRLINRYRRSFLSKVIQSQDNVQEYYSILKNALLSYKGVKGRTSWSFDSYNKGRVKIAKISAKTRTLYLYLALDPAELQNSKYFFEDLSSKKKYAEVPVLMKIKGERKLKYALELIEKVCGEKLELPPVKNFEAVDYKVPYQTTEQLVQEGLIRQLTAAVPVTETAEIPLF